jgi:hypothetical protein
LSLAIRKAADAYTVNLLQNAIRHTAKATKHRNTNAGSTQNDVAQIQMHVVSKITVAVESEFANAGQAKMDFNTS